MAKPASPVGSFGFEMGSFFSRNLMFTRKNWVRFVIYLVLGNSPRPRPPPRLTADRTVRPDPAHSTRNPGPENRDPKFKSRIYSDLVGCSPCYIPHHHESHPSLWSFFPTRHRCGVEAVPRSAQDSFNTGFAGYVKEHYIHLTGSL